MKLMKMLGETGACTPWEHIRPPLAVDHRMYILLTSKLADDVKMFRAVPVIYKCKQQLGTIQAWQPKAYFVPESKKSKFVSVGFNLKHTINLYIR